MGNSNDTQGRILVVDDEERARQALTKLLEGSGYEVRGAADGFKALGELEDWECDLLLTDLRMPMMDGLELLEKVQDKYPDMAAIVITAFGSVDNAVQAMKSGADHYVTKPVEFDQVEVVVERVMENLKMRRELESLRDSRETVDSGPKLVGNSPSMQQVGKMIEQVAPARATVLITGESGTGKELVARQLHTKSNRADKPFVELHCAALSQNLLESELFGHEKGAFTGATSQREGRFEEADGGTLFLDEIGEISEATQVKLLRFLQQREFERVGGNETLSVDVRVVAATNRDLEEAVRQGEFREDLYFRLNVIDIQLPPLRARRDDIPLLVNHFVAQYARENNTEIDRVTPDAMGHLRSYDWPGNVRELENVIERAVVLATGPEIGVEQLPGGFGEAPFDKDVDIRIPGSTLEDIERYALLNTYESTGGSTSKTADILDISVRKVQYKLKEYRENWSADPDE